MSTEQLQELDLHTGLVGFEVLGRGDERIGEVARTSLDRACFFVETRNLLARAKEHVVHRCAIVDVDLDAQTITVAATREQVENAPQYSDLDERCSDEAAAYYSGSTV
jgi:hypothetical protein